MNNPITRTKIETVIKSLPQNKGPGRDGFTGEFHQTLREELMTIFLRLVVCQLLHLLLFSPIQNRTEKPAAEHPPPGTGSQSHKDWKGATADPERLYLPNRKQASLLRLLGVLDSHHLPHRVHQRSTQKAEQQRQKRRQVAAIALAKLLSYSDREGHKTQFQPNLSL